MKRLGMCVENTIKELVPVREILNTYISQDKFSQDLDVSSEIGEDTEDPDIDDVPMDELPEGAQPDPETINQDEPTEPTEPMEPAEPTEPEVKEVNLGPKSGNDDGVLFPDAPDK